MTYVARYHPYIKSCLKKYPNLKERFRKKGNYILKNPFELGEPLKRNLNGLRSFPFAGNFIIIYIICEECRKLDHQKINKCLKCNEIPENSVIFLAFGPHDFNYENTSFIRKQLEKKKFDVFT